VMAQSGQRVILVDADLHRPGLSREFKLTNGLGLSTLLFEPNSPAADVLQPTDVPLLRVLAAGASPADPSALFSSRLLAVRLAELGKLCDVMIFDTPPLLARPDAALLGSQVDAVLYVIDAASSRGRAAARALDVLHRSGATVVGAVLNRLPQKALDYAEYGQEEVERGRANIKRRNALATSNQSPGRVKGEPA